MDWKQITGLVMGVVIGVLLLTTLAMPVISDATTTERTFTNEGFFRMTELSADSDESVTITWDYTEPFVLVINNNDFEIPAGATTGDIFPYTIFATDGWGLRFSSSNGTAAELILYGSSSNTLLWSVSTANSDTATITLSSGTASFVKGTSDPVTQTYTQVFIPDNNGSYVLKKGSEPAYMNGDSIIYSTGRTTATFGANAFALNINLSGDIDDGVTVTILAPTGFTISNVVVDSSEVNGYLDLYSLDKVTFDITHDSTQIKVGATYSQVIVPYEVTAELSQHMSSDTISLLALVPLLITVGIIMAVVGVFVIRRE